MYSYIYTRAYIYKLAFNTHTHDIYERVQECRKEQSAFEGCAGAP